MDINKQRKPEIADILDAVKQGDTEILKDMEQYINRMNKFIDSLDPSVYNCFNVSKREIIYNLKK